MLRHIITDLDWTKENLLVLFETAEKIRTLYNANWDRKNIVNRQHLKKCLFGKTVVILMYEPSTRTRASFELAAKILGADVITYDDMRASSEAKGESLEDTVRTFAAMDASAIVIRHPEEESAQRAVEALKIRDYPTIIINGGDGSGFHPTQCLLDLYTLWRRFGEKFTKRGPKGEFIAGICGDLGQARTIHSLVIGLTLFRIPMVLVAPESNNLPLVVENTIFWRKTGRINSGDLLRWAPIPDFWYFCRLQVERYGDQMSNEELARLEKEYAKKFGCTEEFRRLTKKDAVFLHPGPQREEFPEEAKIDPRSLIGEQIQNGIWTRAALLKMTLNPEFSLLI